MEESLVCASVAAALEDEIRERGITSDSLALTVRSDNDLVFGAKPFVSVTRLHGLERDGRERVQKSEGGVRVAQPIQRSGSCF